MYSNYIYFIPRGGESGGELRGVRAGGGQGGEGILEPFSCSSNQTTCETFI